MKAEPELLVGLDLGTSKVAVVVAERDDRTGEAQIIGVGQALSYGIRKGLIVNLEQAVSSVRNAVEDARHMVGLDFYRVTVAFSGTDVQSVLTRGMVSLGRTPRPVLESDVERAIEVAQSELDVTSNHSVLHAIPVDFCLDGHSGIDDPLGMTGSRLELELQSLIVPTSTIQNVINCVERAGLAVDGLLLKPLAAAMGALSTEEAHSGAAVVDLGGGTTGIAVYSEGRPRRLSVIPVGGDHITNDLACVLKIPTSKAEALKKEVSLTEEPDAMEDLLDVDVRGQKVSFSVGQVAEIVGCRIEEIFEILVGKELTKSGLTMFPAGIVMAGGVANTGGLDSFVSDVLDLPVRTAAPLDANRMPPGRDGTEFAASAGVIRYVLQKEEKPYRYLEPSASLLKGRPDVGGHSTERKILPRLVVDKREADGAIRGLMDTIKKSFRELF